MLQSATSALTFAHTILLVLYFTCAMPGRAASVAAYVQKTQYGKFYSENFKMNNSNTSLPTNHSTLKTSEKTPLTSDADTADRAALTLILGPAGAGKTEWTLQRFQDCQQAGQPALLIVSSPQQALTRIDQLARRLDCAPAEIQSRIRTVRQVTGDLTSENAGNFRVQQAA